MTNREYWSKYIGYNLSWCRPFTNGRVTYAINEIGVVGLEIDGRIIPPRDIDKNLHLAAKILLGDEYDNDDFEDAHAWARKEELSCSECPFFDDCEPIGEILRYEKGE